MDLHPLTEAHVKAGEPLLVDVFDAQGRLLLKAGATPSGAQLARLLEHGLYADPVALEAALPGSVSGGMAAPEIAGTELRVVQMVAQAKRDLEAWQTAALAGITDRPALEAIARSLERASGLDADACMGQISFDRPPSYAARHAVDTALLGALVAQQLGHAAEERALLIRAAITMNLGMVGLQDALYAQSTPLSAEQLTLIRQHPEHSAALLQALGVQDARWLNIVRQHHEAAEGSGYPAGLQADAIDPLARCIAVADQICALLSERAHRDAINPMRAVQKLTQAPPKSLSSETSGALVQLMTPCPPGAVVRLHSADTGVVARRTRHADSPIVMVFLNRMNKRFDPPLRKPSSADANRIVEALPQNAIDPRPLASAIWDEVIDSAATAAPAPSA
ncbi:hypothetical protein IP84_06830 [beta proteobacterium AAP99]|nr:hypothetical protein IP84_06830 [beta proteobacterium AAP99]